MNISLFILICLLAQIGWQLSFEGYRIRDLEGSGTDFIAESAFWKSSYDDGNNGHALVSHIYSICDNSYMLGGPDVRREAISFSRDYINLPPHDMIYFSIQVSLIDAWKSSYCFAVVFSPAIFQYEGYVIGFFGVESSSNFVENKCGDPNLKDLIKLNIYGKVRHKDHLLHMEISYSMGNHQNSSLGFRNFVILFRNSTEEEQSSPRESCGIASIHLPFNECQCPEGQHKASDGSCQFCDPACKTCLGPSPSQCLECAENAFFDGIECKLCHVSCFTCFGASPNQCSSCPEHYFLFEGSSCVSTCASPLIPTSVGSPQYCSFPCPPDKYLYSNGECKTMCGSTYNPIVLGDKKFCSFFCPSGEFYVPGSETAGKGTCLDNCPSGYYTDNEANYCIPCQDRLCASCSTDNGAKCQQCLTEAILDSDGTCKDCRSMVVMHKRAINLGHQYLLQIFPETCDLNLAIIHDSLFGSVPPNTSFPSFTFHFKTSKGNQYVLDLILEESVLDKTNLELTLHHLTAPLVVPKKIIPSKELQEIVKYVPTVQTVLTSILTICFLGALILGSTAAIWSIIGFQQFVGCLQYINIDFPFQVDIFFSLLGSSTWDFLPNSIDILTQPLEQNMPSDFTLNQTQQPPHKFVENNLSSSFIKNGGGIILTNILLLLLLIFLVSLRKLQKLKKIKVVKTILRMLRWNIIVRTYLENGVPLTLAILLQLQSFSFVNIYWTICSIISVAAGMYSVVFLICIFRFLYSKSSNELKKEILVGRYGTLWEGIVLNKYHSKYYHLLIFLRGILLTFLVVFLEEFPILQIAPLILYNIGLIFYMFKEVEFEDKYLDTINRLKEILILIGEMFILGLIFRNGSEKHYNNLGWLIVTCFFLGLITETGYAVGKQVMSIQIIIKRIQKFYYLFCKWLKRKEKKHRNSREANDGQPSQNLPKEDPITMELENFRSISENFSSISSDK